MKKFTLNQMKKFLKNGDVYPVKSSSFESHGCAEVQWVGGKRETVEIVDGCCTEANQWIATKYRDDRWYPACVCCNPAHWAPNCQVLNAGSKEDAIKLCNEENTREERV